MPSSLGVFGSDVETESPPPSFVGKVIFCGSLVVSLLLMWWIARLFSIPSQTGFSASILQQSYWILLLPVIFISMALVMLVSAVLSSPIRSDTPVMCTALACGVISLRGGTMQQTLFYASGPAIFLTLALETAILFGGLALAWLLLRQIRVRTAIKPPSATPLDPASWDEKALAFFTHASVMMALMILLCRSDTKDQSLVCVGLSSAIAAAIAVQLVNIRDSFWLWMGPLAVAVFGYLISYFHPEGWQAGMLHGPLAALSRPLPLDYLSAGPAGAITGYWFSTAAPEADEEE
jgi:hypothetical protein